MDLGCSEIQVASAAIPPTPHQCEIVVAHPDDKASLGQIIAAPGADGAIDRHPPPAARYRVEQALPSELSLDREAVFAEAHQLPDSTCPGGLEAQQHAYRLQNRGLALGVVADE